jgi:hypothetical protein
VGPRAGLDALEEKKEDPILCQLYSVHIYRILIIKLGRYNLILSSHIPISLGVKLQGCEANHPPASSSDFKND